MEGMLNNERTVMFVVKDMRFLDFMNHFIDDRNGEFFCDGTPAENPVRMKLPVHFQVEHAYDVIGERYLACGCLRGQSNREAMRNKAREWFLKYGAELVEISTDTLKFQCGRKLEETEAEELAEEILSLPDSVQIAGNPGEVPGRLLEQGCFTLCRNLKDEECESDGT